MKRLFKILVFIAVIYGVAIYGGFAPVPFKVTDPSDPRFNINRFRFEDYRNRDDLREVMEKFLPAGTPLEEADRILVKIGGAEKSPPWKVSGHRVKNYNDPELYRVYGYFKESWVALLYKRIYPAPGRTDRLVTVDVDQNEKITHIGVYR